MEIVDLGGARGIFCNYTLALPTFANIRTILFSHSGENLLQGEFLEGPKRKLEHGYAHYLGH